MARNGKARIAGILALLASTTSSSALAAAGDLLVAPTRVVLNGSRGAEVLLSNIGSETATYRISLELRRMTADGRLEDVVPEGATDAEKAALEMIRYAPRRVVLPPGQPQSIRLGARPDAALPDGEYRAHLLMRAVPDAQDVTAPVQVNDSLSIALTPIYGVTIPIIIRKGQLQATAAIADPRIETVEGTPLFKLDVSRSGNRSVYGDIAVIRPGRSEPAYRAGGIAVYPELAARTVALPLTAELAAELRGPVRVEYREPAEAGGALIASVDGVIR